MAQVEDPQPRSFAPVWLAPADVREWLRINDQVVGDDDKLIRAMCAVAEPYVERCRPEFFVVDEETGAKTFKPDPEAYHGGVMFAAREFRRRNSPGGIEVLGDSGTSFVARYDADIDRALHTGVFAGPIIA